MFEVAFGLVALALVFGGGVVGLLLGRTLPPHYLDDGTQRLIQVTMGTISVMTALVISLTITQARNTLSSRDKQVEQLATDLVVLNHDLLRYGPDAQEARVLLRKYTALKLALAWPRNGQPPSFDDPHALRLLEAMQDRVSSLQPQNAMQRMVLADALRICSRLIEVRSALAVEHEHEVPWMLLYAIVFWLTILFASFGMFASRNVVTAASLFVSALCLCIALLLIVDMDRPFGGLDIISISPYPIQRALADMGS